MDTSPGPTPPHAGPTVATLAARTVEARRKLVTMFASDLGRTVALDLIGVPVPTEANLRFAAVAQQVHGQALARASLFLADAAMTDLIDAAAPTMPDQHLQTTDIIAPHGFCYFAQLLPDRSGDPPEIPIRAFSWTHLDPGHPLAGNDTEHAYVLLTFYVPVREAMVARGLISATAPLPAGAPALTANATVMWRYDSLIGEVYGEVPAHGPFTPGFYQRVAAAFWTLSQQPGITSTTHAPPGQPTDQRRGRRAGVENPTAPVSVVRLRHPAPDTDGAPSATGTGRKLTVRTAVRGFWRRQWYPSVQSHRHIWIDPHFRGPADAPLVGGERVFLAHPGSPRPAN